MLRFSLVLPVGQSTASCRGQGKGGGDNDHKHQEGLHPPWDLICMRITKNVLSFSQLWHQFELCLSLQNNTQSCVNQLLQWLETCTYSIRFKLATIWAFLEPSNRLLQWLKTHTKHFSSKLFLISVWGLQSVTAAYISRE